MSEVNNSIFAGIGLDELMLTHSSAIDHETIKIHKSKPDSFFISKICLEN